MVADLQKCCSEDDLATHCAIVIRVESGSDDPDNVGHLGHFFDGSSGSHPQVKLSGCDPDFLVH